MVSEEKTSAADIPLKSHQEVTSADEILLESHEEVTSAVDILLESHQERVSCRTSSTDQQIIDGSDEVSLDINEIATSLRDQLKTKRAFSSTRCIYRVPETLRESNEKAFAPRVVSIGPIHHGKETLKAMEDHKIMYLQQFLEESKVKDVLWDMCLLENQLPFFILEELLERYSAAGANPRNRTVIELTCQFLPYLMDEWVDEDSWKTINSSEVLHFVDFIRKCQQPTERSCEEREPVLLSAPTATELHQSGVKFKKSGSKSLLDLKFSDGILGIPQLKIHDRTETLFRNLQAFEQCHYLTEDRFVSDYITFISCLVVAPNDVEVLVQNGSWKNLLNSDEAASNLINKIRKENYFRTDGFLIGICKDLTLHCRKRRHKWKATLKQVYFNNPWTAISVAAATFLLMLTVIQTVCSILQL